MALNSLGLGFVFTASDLASGKIKNLSHQFMGLEAASKHAERVSHDSTAQLMSGFGVLTAGAVTLGVSLGLATAFGKFEQGIARVGAISRATGTELELLKRTAIDAGIATSFSPMEAVEGLEELASQGFSARESAALLKPALQLAEGGMISVSSATAATTSAMKVFGLSVDEALGDAEKRIPSLADKLLAIANSTSLTAKDLELSLGTVGRGAIVTGQSLDEMLIAMGLVKNTGLDASVAAQSVSSALTHVAKQAEEFKAVGVNVTDATGKFRPFLDIVRETADAFGKRYTDQAEAAAEATKFFSRFGLTAYSAIGQQLSAGVKDLSGNLYRGAAAVDFLRREMANSVGVAQQFRDKVLNTFEGQKKLLVGSLQTLAIVAGEGFAMVLRPFVVAFLGATNRLIGFFNSLSPVMKKLLAQVVVGLGAAVAAIGAFMTVFVGVKILLPFITAGFSLLGSVLATVGLPLLALIALYRVFSYVVEKNIGGLGDAWHRFTSSVSLAFRGLVQLFTEGGFSGAVMQEMRRTENSGIRQFVIHLFMLAHRVAQFFRGVWVGFTAALEEAGPVFEKLGEALSRIWQVLGLVGDASAVAGKRSGDFALAGAKVGDVLGVVVETVVTVWTLAANLIGGLVEGFAAVFNNLGPIFKDVGELVSGLADQFLRLVEELGFSAANSGEAGGVFTLLGRIVGTVAGVLVGALSIALGMVSAALSGVVWVLRQLVAGFRLAGEVVLKVAGAIGDAISGIGSAIRAVVGFLADLVDGSIAKLGGLAKALPSFMQTSGTVSLVAAGERAEDRLKARRAAGGGDAPVAEAFGGVEAARARRDHSSAVATGRVMEMLLQQKEDFEARTTVVNLAVDGEKLATATAKAGRSMGRRAFAGDVGSEW